MSDTDAVRASLAVAGAALLVLLAGAWWLDVQSDRHEMPYRHWAYAVQPATIEDWMTFDYLNRVFAVPPAYLETALSIQDPQYPAISIKRYAQAHGLDSAAFLLKVAAALAARAATSTP